MEKKGRKEYYCRLCGCLIDKEDDDYSGYGIYIYDEERLGRKHHYKYCNTCKNILYEITDNIRKIDFQELNRRLKEEYCVDCLNNDECGYEPYLCPIVRSYF